MTIRVVSASPKGGGGKSALIRLTAEWCLHRGRTLQIVDTDENQDLRDWIHYCGVKGRQITESESPDIVLIDTEGTSDASIPFLADADVVLTPFKANLADVKKLIRWYKELDPAIKAKIFLIPNMIRLPSPTRNNVAMVNQIKGMLGVFELGDHLLPGLCHREHVYPAMEGGTAENFFGRKAPSPSFAKAQKEASDLFERIDPLLGGHEG